MNHIFGPYVCRRQYWWSIGSVGKGEGEQGQQRYQAEIFPRLQKYILMAAMDSPVFSFLLKLHLIKEIFVAHITKVGLNFQSKLSLLSTLDWHE